MTELPPRGWVWATLNDLISSEGVFSDGDWVESKDQDPDGEVRLIQLADVGVGRFRNRSHRFLTSTKAAELKCTYLKPRDVLIARMPKPLGRACQFPEGLGKCVTVVDVAVVRPGPVSVDPRWLMWSINSPTFSNRVAALQSGTTRKRISRRNLGAIELAVPPLAEQGRIVERIEDSFSRLDKVESTLASLLDRVKELRSAILFDAFHANGSLPAGWKVMTLKDVAQWGSGGTPRRTQAQYYGGDIPWAIIGDLNNGIVRVCKTSITQQGLRESSCKVIPPGTVMVAMYGASIGRLGIAGTAMATNQAIAFAIPRINRSYLFYYLLSQRTRFMGAGKGAAQRNISQTIIKRWPIPVPPSEEQARIADSVDKDMSSLHVIETVLVTQLGRIQALRQSVLAEAFAGRLVPQNPNDEPATALLKRITDSWPGCRAQGKVGV